VDTIGKVAEHPTIAVQDELAHMADAPASPPNAPSVFKDGLAYSKTYASSNVDGAEGAKFPVSPIDSDVTVARTSTGHILSVRVTHARASRYQIVAHNHTCPMPFVVEDCGDNESFMRRLLESDECEVVARTPAGVPRAIVALVSLVKRGCAEIDVTVPTNDVRKFDGLAPKIRRYRGAIVRINSLPFFSAYRANVVVCRGVCVLRNPSIELVNELVRVQTAHREITRLVVRGEHPPETLRVPVKVLEVESLASECEKIYVEEPMVEIVRVGGRDRVDLALRRAAFWGSQIAIDSATFHTNASVFDDAVFGDVVIFDFADDSFSEFERIRAKRLVIVPRDSTTKMPQVITFEAESVVYDSRAVWPALPSGMSEPSALAGLVASAAAPAAVAADELAVPAAAAAAPAPAPAPAPAAAAAAADELAAPPAPSAAVAAGELAAPVATKFEPFAYSSVVNTSKVQWGPDSEEKTADADVVVVVDVVREEKEEKNSG
jgi:hypothetical protein